MATPTTNPTIGVISTGAMGAAVAHRLTANGFTVLTCLDGRSAASHGRAAAANMQNTSIEEIARRAEYVLSILPPSEARSLARRFAPLMCTDAPFVYVDCNAVSPATVHEIAELFPANSFLDAGIIGMPPSKPDAESVHDPTFYVSGDKNVVERFADVLRAGSLKVGVLQAGVGDASALKLAHAGITKGLAGLTVATVLATNARSPAINEALLRELLLSDRIFLQHASWAMPMMLPRAYRFVREMEEIRDFMESEVPGEIAGIWDGLARVFERVATSVKNNEDDVRVLEEFGMNAKTALQEKKEA